MTTTQRAAQEAGKPTIHMTPHAVDPLVAVRYEYNQADTTDVHHSVIHYNVTFSFKEGVAQESALQRVSVFLTDLRTRALIHDFEIMRTDDGQHVVGIRFLDREQFDRPFKEVAEIGVHAGAHGFMIENVAQITVTTEESR